VFIKLLIRSWLRTNKPTLWCPPRTSVSLTLRIDFRIDGGVSTTPGADRHGQCVEKKLDVPAELSRFEWLASFPGKRLWSEPEACRPSPSRLQE
jgi:hypothetical protein